MTELAVNVAAEFAGTIIQDPLVVQDRIDALLREPDGADSAVVSRGGWCWRTSGATIELLVELQLVTVPWHRTVLLDGGAVLMNLRVFIRGSGFLPVVRLFPDPARRELVATIRLEARRPVTAQDRALVSAALGRPPGGVPTEIGVDTGLLTSALRRAARTEQAWLAVQPLAALQDAADAACPIGDTAPRGEAALMICTVLDEPRAWLQAGQAAQRTTLTAAALGAPVTSALPDPLGVDRNRQIIRELIGGGVWPQSMLHLDPHPQP